MMERAKDRLSRQLCDALTAHLRSKEAPRLPDAGQALWKAFTALSAARGFHQYGPNPISFTEIEAWARLTRTPLQPHHVEIIRALDVVFLEHFAPGKRAPDGVKAIPHRSPHALSPELFDAALR